MRATARAKLARDGMGQIIPRKSSDSAFGQGKAIVQNGHTNHGPAA
jgi:hypothetical protein